MTPTERIAALLTETAVNRRDFEAGDDLDLLFEIYTKLWKGLVSIGADIQRRELAAPPDGQQQNLAVGNDPQSPENVSRASRSTSLPSTTEENK